MKSVLLSIFLGYAALSAVAQQDSYRDSIAIDEINELNVMASDTFNRIVQQVLSQKRLSVSDDKRYPIVYFKNRSNNRYLKIWGGPDLGYGWFFTIGYTMQGKCSHCGTFLGNSKEADFEVNHGIKLGDNVKQIWEAAGLNYFRKFTFMGITYYYFEKGVKQEVPFTPYRLFYYKFDGGGRLIEIGFGYGMEGENPMLHQ